ncbi:bcl-2 homologous antagonist/killer isoform X2 [Meriones unguiculatus]|uniref:bcl-2 homologous antagonist/killer isoform X2 n=1 Tax=Meriones unguiculatus TaxID=10047 RepID=UPI000B4F10C6|nr:bcl-2 homologous antagonist/killer isoform X2 [Meriones unguiculatus]
MVTKSRGFLGRDDPWRRHLDTGNSDAGPCKSGLKPCPWRKPAAPRDSVSRPLSQPTSGAESGETCPPRPDRWHLDKDQVLRERAVKSLPPLLQVARDTEEVFRSYVFYLHHQEQETQGAAAPANPEMDNLSLEPNSVLGQVGRQLALIGDDINRRYDTEFQNLLEQLQPTAGNAYELFTKIASRPAATLTGNPLTSPLLSLASLGPLYQPRPAYCSVRFLLSQTARPSLTGHQAKAGFLTWTGSSTV